METILTLQKEQQPNNSPTKEIIETVHLLFSASPHPPSTSFPPLLSVQQTKTSGTAFLPYHPDLGFCWFCFLLFLSCFVLLFLCLCSLTLMLLFLLLFLLFSSFLCVGVDNGCANVFVCCCFCVCVVFVCFCVSSSFLFKALIVDNGCEKERVCN